MAIELLPLTPERLDDVQTLLLPVWARQWDPVRADRILRWRFLERPDGEATIAYDRGRPVGFVDSFLRDYRNGSGAVRVREPADWYAHPDYRPILGVKLMRSLMARPEPIVTVGANRRSMSILPQLGYHGLPDVTTYALATGIGAVPKALSKRCGFSLPDLPRSLARPFSVAWPRSRRTAKTRLRLSTREIGPGQPIPELGTAGDTYGLSPVPCDEEAAWYRDAPDGIGRFVWLAFETPWNTAGISCSRVYRDGPFVAARLLHMDARIPSVLLYMHMVSETVRFLQRDRPQWISARFSCPMACSALEERGFRKVGSCKAFWWPGEGPMVRGLLHLGWTSGDEAFVPYPA